MNFYYNMQPPGSNKFLFAEYLWQQKFVNLREKKLFFYNALHLFKVKFMGIPK